MFRGIKVCMDMNNKIDNKKHKREIYTEEYFLFNVYRSKI